MNVFTTEYTECTEFHRVLILLLDSICHSERSEEWQDDTILEAWKTTEADGMPFF